MGLFSGIEKIQVRQAAVSETKNKQDNYILPGTHLFEINRVLKHKQEGINGKEFFIVEMKVIESSNEDMKPGQMKSFLESFIFDGRKGQDGQLQYPGMERVKQLILAAVASDGLGPDDITEDMIENEVIGENCLAGRRIKDVAKYGKKGHGFLYNNWYKAE